jgi:DNA-binding response OmpR family regulator
MKLPDGDGIELLCELRKNSNVPVLILTAMGAAKDIIRGLEAGADDYLPKPYDISVFHMRLTALLRRAAIVPDTLGIGPIRIELASNKAYLNGEDMGLQLKELSLLQQFVQHPERMLSAEYLYEKVWGQKMLGQDNALKVAISKMRPKLDESGYTIVASRGEGYSFEKI